MLRFDFVDVHGRAAPLVFERPSRIIEAWAANEVRPAMRAAERALADGYYVAGFIAYEAATAFDDALVTKARGAMPLVWFGVFREPLPADHARLGQTLPTQESGETKWTSDLTGEQYRAAIVRIREAIEAGDSYQTNYTFRLHAQLDVDTLADRYRRLVAEQRPPYAAWIDSGHWQVLSLSPELFFRIDDGTITTRPMKGTAPRGLFAEDDEQQRRQLQDSAKNRAENVMIVDLARNDVGRIADIGSVKVSSLFDIERYPSVFQMTSTVAADVRTGVSLTEIFAALFPAGSITGAPKTSSMRLIADLETSPRGIYCGAIGFMTPAGNAAFNVAIRTAVVDPVSGACEYGVGGGITWDSTPVDEHAEALSKASFLQLQPPFDLLETMRLERGVFVRLDEHVSRLGASAEYFDFAINLPQINRALATHAAAHPDGVRRARLLVSRNGEVRVESVDFAPIATGPQVIELAHTPVCSRDRFLFHKTTYRAVYEQHRAAHPRAFDVLLWNEQGELTEFTIGNLVVELDGARWTPPRACGLLNGVFREELVRSGVVHERVMTRADLDAATRVWLINSLREWVEVTGARREGDRLEGRRREGGSGLDSFSRQER